MQRNFQDGLSLLIYFLHKKGLCPVSFPFIADYNRLRPPKYVEMNQKIRYPALTIASIKRRRR